jgi:hypothetical protein
MGTHTVQLKRPTYSEFVWRVNRRHIHQPLRPSLPWFW